jgi:hypothetical protein
VLVDFERCSINCICWWGRDWEAIHRELPDDEEVGMACVMPQRLGRLNCIAGQSLVSHFAFHSQRGELERERPDLLEKYALLASGSDAALRQSARLDYA